MISKANLITPPVDTPISLDDAKFYLKVDSDFSDDEITSFIYGATSYLEAYLEMKLISQTWDIYFDHLPHLKHDDLWWDGVRDGHINLIYGPVNKINLPFGKLSAITSVSTFDNSDVEYTFDPTNYQADLVSPRGSIALRQGCVWPATVLRPVNGVKIKGVFGYTDQDSVPQDIKNALKMIVAKLYENRGDATDSEMFTMPPTAIALVQHYRMVKSGRA